MSDPWIQHLKKYNLLDLHYEAQTVGYRVRVADGFEFHLEYAGGLAKYYQSPNGLRIFGDTNEGRAEARAFLATVKADIFKQDTEDDEE